MAKVTIDQYSAAVHERYAADRHALEALEIRFDDSYISKDFELAQGTASIQSKWEELFELHIHRHPFASFGIPPRFIKMRKRFFSNALSPEFDWDEEEEQHKEKVKKATSKMLPKTVFEKDRTVILTLLDSIETLNTLIDELNGRKLQYQKG